MVRFLLRLAGTLLLAAGFAALLVDGTRSIASSHLTLASLHQSLAGIAGPSVQTSVQAGLARHLPAWLWRPVFEAVMRAPTFVVLGLAGGLLMLAGRARRPVVGTLRR